MTARGILISSIELGQWVQIPTTYAGGAKGEFYGFTVARVLNPTPDISDMNLVDKLSKGRLDLTFGR